MSYSLHQWKAKGKHIRLLGHNIFYRETENNKPDQPCIVFLHGFPTSSWDWEPLWSLLESDYHLVAFDFLGFGFSDKPYPYDYAIAEQADITEALIEKLSLSHVHVFAHDYGDTVAQELLARQNACESTQWLSLCLLNGGLFPEAHRPKFIQTLMASPLGPFITRRMSKSALHKSMSSIFGKQTPPDAPLIDGFWEAINYNNGRRTLHKIIDYMRQRREHRERWVAALQESCVPLCLINGSADPISGKHMIARFKEVVGNPAWLMSFPAIGHYPQWEATTAVHKSYSQFLSTLPHHELNAQPKRKQPEPTAQ